jgi:hypothetical protein
MASPLWQTILDESVRTQHLDPVKMADSSIRMRNKFLALKKARRATVYIEKPPKQVVAMVHKCRATTLGGRQCTSHATRGGFCTKHFVAPL